MAKKFSKKPKAGNKITKQDKSPLLHSETKKGVLAVVFFTLAVLSVFSFFGGAGLVGTYFYRFSRLLFGRGFFFIAVSFTLVGLAIILPGFVFKKQVRPVYKTILAGAFIFILSILGLFHIFTVPETDSPAVVLAEAGGYAGLVLGYPLGQLFGFWASLVVLSALLVISILVTFNIPLIPSFKREEQSVSAKEEQALLAADKSKGGGLWQRIKQVAKDKERSTEEEKPEPQDSILGKEISGEGKTSGKPKLKETESISVRAIKSGSGFKLPPLDFLEKDKGQPTSGDIKANINIIKRTLGNFGLEVEMAEVNVGPTVTQYTLRPAQGIKLSKITALQNDLALALAAHPLRIEAPIPGRSLVGVEIPNRAVMMVRLRSLLERPAFTEFTSSLVFALGRDVAGNPMFADLCRMPHLLVAGATGTGKTIALNNLIVSLLYRNTPETMRFILIDPKRVELSSYDAIPHLLTPVIVESEKAVGALRWAVGEMERRFGALQGAGNRDIGSYNEQARGRGEEPMPYIVVVIDELADLMSSYGREVEGAIVRLAQMARAVGIHLVVSTQRPSVEVITGLIKANITARMAFQVASQIDSRTILDMAGAEKLLGNGDMLFLAGNSAKPRRVQGSYLADKEVKDVAAYWRKTKEPEYQEDIGTGKAHSAENSLAGDGGADDELYGEAKLVVTQAGKASASLLQRRLRVGYARAARLLDVLEEQGVVGPADGARPRDVYVDEAENQEL